jgi:hypothetical protein
MMKTPTAPSYNVQEDLEFRPTEQKMFILCATGPAPERNLQIIIDQLQRSASVDLFGMTGIAQSDVDRLLVQAPYMRKYVA